MFVTDRRQTDGRAAIAHSERERELTFAKNQSAFSEITGNSRPILTPHLSVPVSFCVILYFGPYRSYLILIRGNKYIINMM